MRCADIMGAASSDPGTGYPGGRWKVATAAYGSVAQQSIQIMMSDGVALVGDVAYPTDLETRQRSTEKFPVLLTQNPYGAGVFGTDYGQVFVAHGYIFASIDVRGTGRSAGTHDMFSPREAEDGAALVAWAAALQGSDGRVGLQGCSQLGINQLETATLLGPDSPVKAMIPACASGDFYRDTAFDNGVPTIVGSLLATDAANGGDQTYYREYWKTRDRLARAPAIARANIPMLLWSGWHEPGSLGSLELYTALQNLAAGRPADAQITADQPISGRYQVILGDWTHGGGLDLGLQLQWFDTWIKGLDTGLATQTKTPLHLAELGGTKRWINTQCYPLVETYTPMYLANGGKLGMSAEATDGQDMLKWTAPGNTSAAVEYVSEPFADGAMLAGPIAAQLQVTSSNKNLQLFIEVLDHGPDGRSVRLSQGSILGTLRRKGTDKSWSDAASMPKRPYLTLDEDQALTPNEPTLLEVPLWPTVWSVEPKHSIVVRISTQPNSNDCLDPLGVPVGCYPSDPKVKDLTGGTYGVHRGGRLASLISLPLVKHGAFATATSAVSPTAAVTNASSADARPLPIDW
jgi:predicted acyl esterase